MSTMADERVGDFLQHQAQLELNKFNTGPQANKALPLIHNVNGAPNCDTTSTSEGNGVVGGSTQGGMGDGPAATAAYMNNQGPPNMVYGAPQAPSSTSGMMPTGNGRLPSPTSADAEMASCLQPVSEDSIDGQLQRVFASQQPAMHHPLMHHSQSAPQPQAAMQHSQPAPQQMTQYQMYHFQQQQLQQMHQQHMQQVNRQDMQMQQSLPQHPMHHGMYAPAPPTSAIQAPTHVNESSNLSSAGSVSDREHEGGTPQRPVLPQASSTAGGTEKKPRKRRRINDDQNANSTGTPKHERKITEFIKTTAQASPKRFLSAGHIPTGVTNGVTNYTESHVVPQQQQQHSDLHQVGQFWGVTSPSPVNRVTPTPAQYSSDSNSNSNQSPPIGTVRLRVDESCQTEAVPSSSVPQEELTKRDRIIEEQRRQIDEAQNKLAGERRKHDAAKETIKRLLIEKNIIERKALREKTTADTPRIGCFKTMRTGDSFRDQWTDGYAFEEVERKQQKILNERNDIANSSALLKKRKPHGIGKEGAKRSVNALNAQMAAAADAGSSSQPSTSNAGSSGDDAIFRRPEEPKEINYQEYIELEEMYKLMREHLKKEEMDLQLEREKLDRERQLHIRELKRIGNEMASSYRNHSLLNKRYLMLSLLGKGGFSEVWKAFDIEENRYVACKIHHVNKDWKEEKKANYVKHAMREKDIHKSLDHCRIVKLYDLFTIDNHSFCTVLEYCPGNDLDFYLKQNKQISEKEARSIIMQVVSALVYLNEKRDPIIHYDLKPANILLESGNACGAIKITDFGLSKIVEASEADHDWDGIELTSQFAGTYWYLPPETFVVPPPKITCKVDVWSVGVIFYQCIYGKKPFGNELTQQKILEYNTIINAREVSFPPKPQVSQVAQDFIRRCLQYKKEDRADVFELARHELFRPRGATRAAAGAINSPSIPRSPSINKEDDTV